MELALAVIGAGGVAASVLHPLARRGLGAVEASLVAMLTGAVAVGVTLSWGLLASLGPRLALALWAAAGVGAAVAAHRRGHRALAVGREAVAAVRGRGVVWLVAAVVVVTQVVLTAVMLRDVGDVGWDAATYHLAMAGSMLQEGSLFGFPDLRPWMYYPALVEVQAAVLGSGLGSVKAASLTQLAYWVWLVVFTAAFLGRRVRSLVAVAGVVVVASIPTLWLQARTLYVDVAFAALFVAAGVVVVVAWQERSRALVLVAALLTGALFGIKLGALAALPLVLAVAASAVAARFRVGLLVVTALGVVAAAPFLVRNAVEWSNPTYPVSLTEAREPVDEWPGYAPYSLPEIGWYVDTNQRPPSLSGEGRVDSTIFQYIVSPSREYAAHVGLTEGGDPDLTARVDSREGGFGFAWLVLAVAGAVAAIALLARRLRRPRQPLGPMTVPAALATVAAVSYVATQAAWWPRFTLGSGVLVALAALLILDELRTGVAVAAVAVLLGVVGLVSTEQDGGYGHWTSCDGPGCVATAEARQDVRQLGLSGLTLDYRPLVEAGVETLAIVGGEPNWARPYFPAGMWSPDWSVHVENLTIGSEVAPGVCHDAYLADAAAQEWTMDWLAGSDPAGSFDVVAWADRNEDRVFVIRETPCGSVEERAHEE